MIKDSEGNIKIIGKYQPQQMIKQGTTPFRPPSRLKYNPIVYDKIFKKVQQGQDITISKQNLEGIEGRSESPDVIPIEER